MMLSCDNVLIVLDSHAVFRFQIARRFPSSPPPKEVGLIFGSWIFESFFICGFVKIGWQLLQYAAICPLALCTLVSPATPSWASLCSPPLHQDFCTTKALNSLNVRLIRLIGGKLFTAAAATTLQKQTSDGGAIRLKEITLPLARLYPGQVTYNLQMLMAMRSEWKDEAKNEAISQTAVLLGGTTGRG